MTKINDIRERFQSGGITTDDVHYLIDFIDIILAYNMAEILPPEDICEPCKYHMAGITMVNCEQPIDDCQGPMEMFFERALESWYGQITEETKE